MNTDTERDENWSTCPKCGSPVMIDPYSGQPETCAHCVSLASKEVGALGMGFILAGVIAIVGLLYLCFRLLLPMMQ